MAQVNWELGVELDLLIAVSHDAAGRLEAAHLRATERVLRPSIVLADAGVTRRRPLLMTTLHDFAVSRASVEIAVGVEIRGTEGIVLLDAKHRLQLVRG